MSLGAGDVVLNQCNIEPNTGVEVGDRRMQRRLKPLAPRLC